MKSLIWKELRENLKWLILPIVLVLAPTFLLGPHRLMDMGRLLFAGIIAAVFGAMLGYLQMHSESQGDKRSLLLHRPLSRSRIFLGKALAGMGLYLLALGIPFAWVVIVAVTPGQMAEPFRWPMVLPWLADILAGLVFYFAGMLAAQANGRWYGGHLLCFAAGLFCTLVVYIVPEFEYAVLAIIHIGGAVALAAWGSFCHGGIFALQPRVARLALGATYLMGLFVVGFIAKTQLGRWFTDLGVIDRSLVDRQGRVLHVHQLHEEFRVTDHEGKLPPGLKSELVDFHALQQIQAPGADHGNGDLAVRRSYRSWIHTKVKYANDTKPGNENWFFMPDQGWLVGYDKPTKMPIGSFGPDGFARVGEQPRERFQGPIFHRSAFPEAQARDYLAFPGGVYRVDFGPRTVIKLFSPAEGQTVLWAGRLEDEHQKTALAFVGTNTSIEVAEETGRHLASLPLAYDLATWHVQGVGRLENPGRYWVWFEPHWYLPPESVENPTGHLIEYNDAGMELARQTIPLRLGGVPLHDPRMLNFEPTSFLSLCGLVTPPVEFVLISGTKQYLVGDVLRHDGREMWPAISFLFFTTQFYLPSVGYLPRTPSQLTWGFGGSMLLAAVLSALISYLLCRRYAFARRARVSWACCGLLFGPFGLLLLLAVQQWPARIACPKCRVPRVVTLASCEHCGAGHAAPAPDGTEIFEDIAAGVQPLLMAR
jgi:hypothetical protein